MSRFFAVALVLFCSSFGCAVYRGSAKAAEPGALAREGGWMMVENFPMVRQSGSEDCGGAALASVLRYWGHPETPESVETAIGGNDKRLRAGDMATFARKKGLRA